MDPSIIKVDARGRKYVPYSLDCPSCFGSGCGDCKKKGFISLDTCPNCLSTPEINFIRRSHEWMERGFLPFPGSWGDQPKILIDALDAVEALTNYYKRKAEDRLSRQK